MDTIPFLLTLAWLVIAWLWQHPVAVGVVLALWILIQIANGIAAVAVAVRELTSEIAAYRIDHEPKPEWQQDMDAMAAAFEDYDRRKGLMPR
jgi:hypothetical protein